MGSTDPDCGAGGRTRTDMSVTSPDFESGAYTNFATPALRGEDNKACRIEAQPVEQYKVTTPRPENPARQSAPLMNRIMTKPLLHSK